MMPLTLPPLRRLALVLAALLALAVLPAAAHAQAPAPFGHACTLTNGVRFCPTTEAGPGRTVDGVKTFDGVPLDVDVTLPATGKGPFPTIVMLHGYGNSKTNFESTRPEGDGSVTYHYNNVFFARRGYAVLNYTVRGFGHSCGGGPTADHTGDCANGYIRLADTRFEARDAQLLVGQLVDQGIAKPGAIGVTGISYGGGQSMELAYLKNRIRVGESTFIPWTSPKGTPLSITAAWPRWPWSDLVFSLLPNGRFLDFDPRTDGSSRDPIGVPIQTYITGLLALGQQTGYYCGNPPSSPCPNVDDNLPLDYALVSRGEPVGPDQRAVADAIFAHHQAFGLPRPRGGVAPLLIENGWTDDLFPPSEALRIYNDLRKDDPHAPVSLQFGDLGHSRGSNKAKVNHAFNDQGASFFDARLLRGGVARAAATGVPAPAPGAVTAFTQTCPKTTPDGGPFTAASWPDLHPLALSFGSAATQTVTSAGDLQSGPPFDPIAGTSNACTTISGSGGPGTATYTLASRGFTLLGLPTVTATIATTGSGGQLDSRLYDVLPDGSERLISRGVYRLTDNQTGRVTFQLHGNGYFFAPGHTVKLELRGNDAPYLRPSNFPFSVAVSDLRVALPVVGDRLGLAVRPASTTAGRRTRFALAVTAPLNGGTVPVAGATVRMGGAAARTDARGRAVLTVGFPRAGTYRATATKAGFVAGSASVRVRAGAARAPGRGPRFTG